MVSDNYQSSKTISQKKIDTVWISGRTINIQGVWAIHFELVLSYSISEKFFITMSEIKYSELCWTLVFQPVKQQYNADLVSSTGKVVAISIFPWAVVSQYFCNKGVCKLGRPRCPSRPARLFLSPVLSWVRPVDLVWGCRAQGAGYRMQTVSRNAARTRRAERKSVRCEKTIWENGSTLLRQCGTICTFNFCRGFVYLGGCCLAAVLKFWASDERKVESNIQAQRAIIYGKIASRLMDLSLDQAQTLD